MAQSERGSRTELSRRHAEFTPSPSSVSFRAVSAKALKVRAGGQKGRRPAAARPPRTHTQHIHAVNTTNRKEQRHHTDTLRHSCRTCPPTSSPTQPSRPSSLDRAHDPPHSEQALCAWTVRSYYQRATVEVYRAEARAGPRVRDLAVTPRNEGTITKRVQIAMKRCRPRCSESEGGRAAARHDAATQPVGPAQPAGRGCA